MGLELLQMLGRGLPEAGVEFLELVESRSASFDLLG
jgi:hypothetical protein